MSGLESQVVEGLGVLDRDRRLGAEGRQELDVGVAERALAPVEDGERAKPRATLDQDGHGEDAPQALLAHALLDVVGHGHARVVAEVGGPHGPPLGHRQAGGGAADRDLESREEIGADLSGPGRRVEHHGLRVQSKENGGVSPADLQGLRGDRRHDAGGIEAPHQRLAGLVQPLQVHQAPVGFPVEPHLLAQQADKDQPHADRSGEAGQVPADAVPVRVEEESGQADQPDERGDEEKRLESGLLVAAELRPSGPERPDSGEPVGDTGGPARERRQVARAHDHRRQERADLDDGDADADAQNQEADHDPDPRAIAQPELAVAVVGGQSEADQREEVAQEEKVRRDPGVDAGGAGVVGLGKDVGEREEPRHPEGHPEHGRLDVLAQAVALQAEVGHADRHERERAVEDGHGIRDGEAIRSEEPREEQGRLVEDRAEGDGEQENVGASTPGSRGSPADRKLFHHGAQSIAESAGRKQATSQVASRGGQLSGSQKGLHLAF